jgi:hypothetical protein
MLGIWKFLLVMGVEVSVIVTMKNADLLFFVSQGHIYWSSPAICKN